MTTLSRAMTPLERREYEAVVTWLLECECDLEAAYWADAHEFMWDAYFALEREMARG